MSSPLKVSRRDALKWGCIAGLAPIAGPVLASNAPMFDPLIRACGELHPIGNDLPLVEDVLSEEAGEETMLRGQEAAAVRVHPSWGRWNPRRVSEGRPLRVAFMQSDHLLNQVVIDAALEWQRHMALRFEFVGTYRGANNPGNLDILVTQDSIGNSSSLGVVSRAKANNGIPSLHLQRFTNANTATQIKGVVLHELGHALGLIHEHQNPEAKLDFNEEAVLAYYKREYGWSDDETRRNVLSQYAVDGAHSIDIRTNFDPASIMMYHLPAMLFGEVTGGFSQNHFLSRADIAVIQTIYG